jgi:CheY-like chemotaxis protein
MTNTNSPVKPTVLIVEDEQALNDAYQTILRKEGFTVYAAFDGTEALELCRTIEPDVILLDLRMPEMGGIAFLEQYDAPEQHPNVQIIVFSNLDTQAEINEAYKLGAQRYMLKAWASPKELVKLIQDTLDSANRTKTEVSQARR